MIRIIAMKMFNLIVSAAIIIASAVLCRQNISDALANQQYKNDYAEINHIKYGLFSVDEWKRRITVIFFEEIDKLNLSETSEEDLRKHIEVLMNTLIDKVDEKIRKENEGSAEGWIKQTFINIFVSLEDIKKGIPEYAGAVIQELRKKKTKRQIKTILKEQLKEYSKQTFELREVAHINRILLRTDSKDIETARSKLNTLIASRQDRIVKEAVLLIALSIVLFASSGFSRAPLSPSQYIFLVLSLIILLITGITTPMIDLEAKISEMSFVLMGHQVHFEDQVLYFQSKSILDVFWIMITHKDLQMKFVGLLLITFSIVFPLLKLLSTLGYYFDYRHARENRVIKFFVLQSGKWSMADVMVIAIFMAYIGFNGIITSQFGQLSSTGQELVILTTNGTSLQPGYYLFLTYTLLALFLSGFLTRKPREAGCINREEH